MAKYRSAPPNSGWRCTHAHGAFHRRARCNSPTIPDSSGSRTAQAFSHETQFLPARCLLFPGRGEIIEVKRGSGKASKLQQELRPSDRRVAGLRLALLIGPYVGREAFEVSPGSQPAAYFLRSRCIAKDPRLLGGQGLDRDSLPTALATSTNGNAPSRKFCKQQRNSRRRLTVARYDYNPF